MSYPTLDGLVGFYLNVDVGFSEEEAVRGIRRELQSNPEVKTAYESELARAFQDPDFSWKNFFEGHHAIEDETESSAREYAVTMLQNAVLVCGDEVVFDSAGNVVV